MAPSISQSVQRRGQFCTGPWIWGVRRDLAVFGGSAAFALCLVWLGQFAGWTERSLSPWLWLGLVLGVDVAHVYATLFRTYFDPAELARHPLRYAGIPLLVYALGVALYAHGPLTFWRVLAYVALFHFVRQQIGWVAIYRARAGRNQAVDRLVDDAVVYAATLYPTLHWHARIGETEFAWFVAGDFIERADVAALLLPWLHAFWWMAIAAFVLRQGQLALQTRSIDAGKVLVVSTTIAIWYVGIVAHNSDFSFTVTNVVVHGVPYAALIWSYARAQRAAGTNNWGTQIVAGGFGAFIGVLLLLAFIEELAWDRLVWHERPWLFGDSDFDLGAPLLTLLVPLLALPQATHYALDGLLWRRRDTRERSAQQVALGGGAYGSDRAAEI